MSMSKYQRKHFHCHVRIFLKKSKCLKHPHLPTMILEHIPLTNGPSTISLPKSGDSQIHPKPNAPPLPLLPPFVFGHSQQPWRNTPVKMWSRWWNIANTGCFDDINRFFRSMNCDSKILVTFHGTELVTRDSSLVAYYNTYLASYV